MLRAAARPDLLRYTQYPASVAKAPGPRRGTTVLLKLCLVLLVVAIPFKAAELVDLPSFDFGLVPIYAAVALFAVAFAFSWIDKRVKLMWPKPIRYIAAFGLLVALSVLQSAQVPAQVADLPDRKLWLFGATQSAYLLCAIIALLLLFNVFAAFPAFVWTALRAQFAISLFVCAWGIFQFLAYYRRWDYPLIFNNNLHYAQLYMELLGSFKRVNSTATEPSMLAIYLLSILPVAFYCVTKKVRILSPGLDAAVLVLNGLVLLMTVSLTGFLGIFLIALLLARLGQLPKVVGGVLAAAILTLCVVLLSSFSKDINAYVRSSSVLERFTHISAGDDLSVEDRGEGMVMGLRMFIHHPLLGVGEGNSVFYYYYYSDKPISSLGMRPRISAVGPRVLAEHGLVGTFLLLAFVWITWRYKSPPSAPSQVRVLQESLRVSFLVTFLVMIISMGEFTHYEFWLMGAASLALALRGPGGSSSPAPASRTASQVKAAGYAGSAGAYAARRTVKP